MVGEPCRTTSSATGKGTGKTGWLAGFLAARPLRYCAAVAASVVIFMGGIAVARLGMTPERETVLMASSDNT
ncbi:MAG TPA: hypothetical protein DDX40_01570, partial [Rikenellaceae bacterium]|nr:hypothetical protein [Rikenellaceae bacterium]